MIKTNEQILFELNEYNKKPHNGIKSGISNLDEIMRLDRQRFAIVTSNENQGKTTFLTFYSYMMAKTNGMKTLFLSFENGECLFYNKLQTLWGNNEFVRFSRFLPHDNFANIEDMFASIDNYLKEWGFDILIIDPYESLQDLMNGNFRSEDYGKVLEQIRQYTQRNNIITILSAHQKKLQNEDDEPTISNIFGSVSFGNKADFIFSIKQERPLITKIKTLKIRNNFQEGKKGKEIYFSFNPRNQRFYEIDKEKKKDFRFEDLALQSHEKRQETPLKDHEKRDISNDKEQDQTTRENERIDFEKISNVMVDTYKTCEEKAPSTQKKLLDGINISNANDEQTKEIIKSIRATEDKTKKRELKLKLPCSMISVRCDGTCKEKENIKEYHNIICIDVDHDDNTKYSIEQLKEIVNNSPYVFYSALSCSGKGLLCLICLDGTINDFLPHYYALETYFKQMDIVIDKSCKNPNRLRFVTSDDKPYLNPNALIYKCLEQRETKKVSVIKSAENKTPSKNDIETLAIIETETKENHLQLTKNHADTLYLANILYSMMGEDGRQYLHVFRQQRKGYDKYKLDDLYNYVASNETTYISNPMGALKAKYNEAIKNQFYN